MHRTGTGWVGLSLVAGALALMAMGCSSSSSSSGSSGSSSSNTATNIAIEKLDGTGTATIADGTYKTDCRTCESTSTCSDRDTMVVSGNSFTFTTEHFSDLACLTPSGADDVNTVTGTVTGTTSAGCFEYTPTVGGFSVPSCASVGLDGLPTASKISFSASGGPTKGVALMDNSGAQPIIYTFDDRGPDVDSDGYALDLSTFGNVMQ